MDSCAKTAIIAISIGKAWAVVVLEGTNLSLFAVFARAPLGTVASVSIQVVDVDTFSTKEALVLSTSGINGTIRKGNLALLTLVAFVTLAVGIVVSGIGMVYPISVSAATPMQAFEVTGAN